MYANEPAAKLFGYGSGSEMVGADVRSLMPSEVARNHRGLVGSYLTQANIRGTLAMRSNKERIMGAWRNIRGVCLDGTLVDLQANVADIRNPDDASTHERYFVAIFRDRTEEVQREEALQEALEKACTAKSDAERSEEEAESARKDAEKASQKQGDLANQVNLLLTNLTGFSPAQPTPQAVKGTRHRQWIITSTITAVLMFGVLMLESTGSAPVPLLERVLLVFAGVLGTSLSGVCGPRNT
jgi:PAS domain S-box-containing protein